MAGLRVFGRALTTTPVFGPSPFPRLSLSLIARLSPARRGSRLAVRYKVQTISEAGLPLKGPCRSNVAARRGANRTRARAVRPGPASEPPFGGREDGGPYPVARADQAVRANFSTASVTR